MLFLFGFMFLLLEFMLIELEFMFRLVISCGVGFWFELLVISRFGLESYGFDV